MTEMNWEQLPEIRAVPMKRCILFVHPLEVAGMVFA
jgi:hypothetical protein